MDERLECCRYEPSLEDLRADEVMTPVLRSAGLEALIFDFAGHAVARLPSVPGRRWGRRW